jgi:hypothetical protein
MPWSIKESDIVGRAHEAKKLLNLEHQVDLQGARFPERGLRNFALACEGMEVDLLRQ